jgi:hypothetical protein
LALALLAAGMDSSLAGLSCTPANTVVANVVAIDQPLMINRLGSMNANGMMYALERDVVARPPGGPGTAMLRLDKRPRPLVLRVTAGGCLTVNLKNWLTGRANQNVDNIPAPMVVNDQAADRRVGFHAQGMQYTSMNDDGAYVGKNTDSMAAAGGTKTYQFYAEKEGTFLVSSYGAVFGADGTAGNVANGLFAAINVEPAGAKFYRSQLTEEEMRLATTGTTADGHPIINYEALYPSSEPWITEGKAGKPILNMLDGQTLFHSDINAIIAGPNADGSFPPSTYPLESKGVRNPSLPNRLEAFREFTVLFHDEMAIRNAFPLWYDKLVGGAPNPLAHTLHPVGDVFMVNYGSAGIGNEIIANRLGVGPMHDCVGCVGEEFFLTSHAVGDPAMLVDIPANVGLENVLPPDPNATPPLVIPEGAVGPKATAALYPDDPSNVHHSYISDFVKFRNLHTGREHHIFHLHNHQWLFNPNDDNSNYLDAQAIGPGSGYTYEINFGGSGNRNKSAGDAIFHCHFYPHFAQGMWELWRNHDVFEPGTRLAVSGADFHTDPYDLYNGKPAAGARALPDGEIVAGTPIPALVPLPGKAMAPMPGKTEVVANLTTVLQPRPDPANPNGPLVPTPLFVGSLAKVDRGDFAVGPERAALDARDGILNDTDPLNPGLLKNPGFPFWVGGIEQSVGNRPSTPPLDMEPNPADFKSGGWDGGLPRHTLDGVAASGAGAASFAASVDLRLDVTKEVHVAKPHWLPESGTDIEKVAMAYHAIRNHPSYKLTATGPLPADFVTNGSGRPVPGAPFHEPCIDDNGTLLHSGVVGSFFDGSGGKGITGSSPFNADTPRVYKGANIQFDAVFNKAGWHFPQERIIALWDDALPIINKAKAPEPLVMRMNTFDCTMYLHTNLVPSVYELDDYQVRTTTDIIGQHIHLPKWDLSTTDGSANGWNYEDGTLSPDAVRERIHAVNAYLTAHPDELGSVPPNSDDIVHGNPGGHELIALSHPQFLSSGPGGVDWTGARTTLQRWFSDPVVNVAGVHRGLGIIFTHDHFGPSTHQQVGLYATVLSEPPGSTWVQNENGTPLYTRHDGGPTSWQAAILTGKDGRYTASGPGASLSDLDGDGQNDSHREFYLEYSDFQHAYMPGVYIGADQNGVRGNPANAVSFKSAINLAARKDIGPADSDLVTYNPVCPDGINWRPCPEAIAADDPGTFVVNYRNEPVGLRVYDPNKFGPDGNPATGAGAGTQADGQAGDLAWALATRTDRKYEATASFGTAGTNGKKRVMNAQPIQGDNVNDTLFPPPINTAGVQPGDPFTPMMRAYYGDRIRIKAQAGGDEELHNITVHGLKWLQGGSGYGWDPSSGWRNFQEAGISEQFTFASPVLPLLGNNLDAEKRTDHAYSMDTGVEGWWNGTWGLLRSYGKGARPDLFPLPNNPQSTGPLVITNKADFKNNGVCPLTAKNRLFDVTAVLANDVLGNALGATIPASYGGGTLNPAGGTLVYNPRKTDINPVTIPPDGAEPARTIPGHLGGVLHDPTAQLLVMTADLVLKTGASTTGCMNASNVFDPKLMTCPVASLKLKDDAPVEPIVLRAAAGECLKVTLRNRLPAIAPDLKDYQVLPPVVLRNPNHSEGPTTFNSNQLRPSSYVGLHSQLLAFDVTTGNGTATGVNGVNPTLAAPGTTQNYVWYAGDLSMLPQGAGRYKLVATPVEFGGINLSPADLIEQPKKSQVGAVIIEPAGATWADEVNCATNPAKCQLDTVADNQSDLAANPTATRKTRTMATVKVGTKTLRSFAAVMQWGLSQSYKDGLPVEGLGAANVISEDFVESGQLAVNGRSDPLWFRFGKSASVPWGGGAGSLRTIPNAGDAYANSLTGGDPSTAVFKATRGQPVNFHLLYPTGNDRGMVFTLHGHVWQRAPYTCPGSSYLGLAGNCKQTGFFPNINANFEVASKALGNNPESMYLGAQDSVLPGSHFDFVLPSAGGSNGVAGDYLFRDMQGVGNLGGAWGIMRVE